LTTRDSNPGWLASLQNGALGEARVRSFLLERFWVMTRSVDVQGADFLIQRRNLLHRFTDLLPPRLGVVQAKFSQDEETTHYLPERYAIGDGEPLTEFFVIIAQGTEDRAKLFLLSAADLSGFPLADHNGSPDFRLATRTLKPFEVRKMADGLDMIEHSLATRSETDNERFLRSVHVPDFNFRRRDLDSVWLLPIPNEHAFLPDSIYQIRISLRSVLYNVDTVLANAAKILTTRDAEICAKVLSSIWDDPAVAFDEQDFVLKAQASVQASALSTFNKAVTTHNTRLRKLKKARRLDDFVHTSKKIIEAHAAFTKRYESPNIVTNADGSMSYAKDRALTRVRLDRSSLTLTAVSTRLIAPGKGSAATKGQLAANRELWRYEHDYPGLAAWRELHRMHTELMRDYYALLFPSETLGPIKLPLFLTE
jgi:hypothetical protein